MDIVCIVLGIIDIFKPSMVLSIIAVCVGIGETALLSVLCKNDKPFPWLSYSVGIFCIIIGVINICVL